MLPAFAIIDDLEARLPAGIGAGDDARAQAALDDASALIRAVAGKNWVSDDEPPVLEDVPDIVTTVCLKVAQRAFTNPNSVNQETTGPFSASYSDASPDVYLKRNERQLILAAAGKNGLTTRSTTRGPLETGGCLSDRWGVADEYVDVEPPGEPIPFA